MIVAGLLLLGAGAARAELPLTEAEAAWLRDHPSVTVGMDSGYAPINHLDAAGRPAGIAIDLLRLIEAKSGLSIDWFADRWSVVIDRALRHQVAAVINRSEERRTGKEFLSTCRSRWVL